MGGREREGGRERTVSMCMEMGRTHNYAVIINNYNTSMGPSLVQLVLPGLLVPPLQLEHETHSPNYTSPYLLFFGFSPKASLGGGGGEGSSCTTMKEYKIVM